MMQNQEYLEESYVLMSVIGDDAHKFLQGQMTCDIASLSLETPVFGACCDYKGRVVANGYLVLYEGSPAIILPQPTAEVLRTYWQKFIIFSKAQLHIQKQFKGVMLRSNPEDALFSFVIAGEEARVCCFYNQKCIHLSHNGLNIESKQPFIYPQTSGLWLPQMIGMNEHQGICFSKGCFVGQEVIAKIHYLKQLKRQLHRGLLQLASKLLPGTCLQTQQGSTVGHVCESVCIDEACHFLAVIKDSALDQAIYINNTQISVLTHVRSE